MPFKTRRQKEAAEKHRLIYTESHQVTYQKEKSPGITLKEEVPVAEILSKIPQEEYALIRKDLLKIAILSLMIIAAQITLSLQKP